MTYLLSDEIRRLAREDGDSTALTDDRATWTFSELNDRSTRFANAARSTGVRVGDRVAVLDKNSTETVEVLFGAAKAGAVTTVVNWRFTPAELSNLLRHAAPTLAIIHVDFLDSFRSQMDGLGFDLPYVTVGGVDDHAIAEYEAWLSNASPVDDGYQGAPDDVVIQIYTSGTTGSPKGALATNRAVGTGTSIASFSDYGPGAHSAVVMPMFHIGGIEPLLIGFSRQCPAYIIRDLDPAKFLDLIES